MRSEYDTAGGFLTIGLEPTLAYSGELLEGVAVGRDVAAADAEGPGDLADVDVALAVDRQAVWRAEHARVAPIRAAPAGQDRAVRRQHADPAGGVHGGLAVALGDLADPPPELRDVNRAVRADLELGWTEGVLPLLEVVAVRA